MSQEALVLENRISEYKSKYCYFKDKGLIWDMIKMEMQEEK